MSPRSLIAVTAILLGITLVLVSPASAARPKRARICCTTFHRKPINPQNIRGYLKIPDTDNCRLSGIIFFTKNDKICVKPEDKWVQRVLAILSERLKNEAKPNSGAEKTQATKGVTPSFNDETASFFSTTEAIINNTESIYW